MNCVVQERRGKEEIWSILYFWFVFYAISITESDDIANNNNDTIKLNEIVAKPKMEIVRTTNEWMNENEIFSSMNLHSIRSHSIFRSDDGRCRTRSSFFPEIALIGLVQFIGVNKVFAIRHKKENEKTREKNFWHTRTRSRIAE